MSIMRNVNAKRTVTSEQRTTSKTTGSNTLKHHRCRNNASTSKATARSIQRTTVDSNSVAIVDTLESGKAIALRGRGNQDKRDDTIRTFATQPPSCIPSLVRRVSVRGSVECILPVNGLRPHGTGQQHKRNQQPKQKREQQQKRKEKQKQQRQQQQHNISSQEDIPFSEDDPWAAAKRGNMAALQRFEATFPDMDWTLEDASCRPPLYYACKSGSLRDIQTVQFLLQVWPTANLPTSLREDCKRVAPNRRVARMIEAGDNPNMELVPIPRKRKQRNTSKKKKKTDSSTWCSYDSVMLELQGYFDLLDKDVRADLLPCTELPDTEQIMSNSTKDWKNMSRKIRTGVYEC